MSDNPMAAALARLHAERPDLPTDGGPVWEPVQDDGEDAEAPTPLARSEQAVTEAEPIPLRWGLNDVLWGDDDSVTVLLSGPGGEPYWLELDPERAAVLRQDLAGPDGEAPPADRATAGLTVTERDVLRFALDLAQDQIHSRGNEFDEDDQAAVDTLRRMAWETPQSADACQLHGPTGDPCGCGCDAGADCHPNPRSA